MQSTERLYSLELLRGAAAFGVAVPHLLLFAFPDRPLLEGIAALGVEVFFVLSGFVLAPQLMRCMDDLRNIPTFLARRWMRTIPLYWLALVCASLIYGELGSADFFRYLVYVQNLFGQENAVDYFSIAWSLSVEEWFYITFPLALFLGAPFLPRGRAGIATVACGIIVACLIARIAFPSDNWGSEVRRVVAFRLDAIAWGVLLYLSAARIRLWKGAALSVAAGLLAGLSLFGVARGFGLAEHVFPFAAAAYGAGLLLTALSLEPYFAHGTALGWFAKWAGRISYSVYLFHLIFAEALLPWLGDLRVGVKLPLFFLALGGLCVTIYWLFERPILKSRPNFRY